MLESLRTIHIVAGSFCLLTGALAFVINKWSPLHRNIGKMFIWSMLLVGVSAVWITFFHPNDFLLAIAVFSVGMVINGNIGGILFRGKKPATWMRLIVLFFLTANLLMVLKGADNQLTGNQSGILLIVFGSIGTVISVRFFRELSKTTVEKKHYFTHHVSGMIGGFISSVTAFAVNTIHFEPTILVWLAPTVILAPTLGFIAKSFASKNNLSR